MSLDAGGMTQADEQETIRQIVGLARGGRMDEAAIAVRRAAARGAGGPVFAALAGAVEFHRGQFADAIPHLRLAHSAQPADMTVRANLVEALYRTGAGDQALALCEEDAARADRSLRLARIGGHLAQEAGDFTRAAALYRIALAGDPRDWSGWNNLGNALSALEDWDGAIAALRRAVELAPDSAPVRLNLGKTLIEAGRGEEGEALLRALVREFPQEAATHYAMFDVLRGAGDADGAHQAISAAARLAPDDAQIQADWGQHCAMMGLFDEVEAPLRKALAIDPSIAPAWVGLASVLERLNREDEIEPLRATAAAHLDAASLSFIDALRHKRAHRYDDALAALEAAGEDTVTTAQRHHLRGVLLDRLGRYDEAFAAFAAMNAEFATDPTDPRGRGACYRAEIDAGAALLTPAWRAGWGAFTPASTRPAPIFLLGFPRSGTTLLDTMLMAEPRVRVLEEAPIIAEIEAQLGGIAALPGVSAGQIEEARALYFARAAELADMAPDSIVLDKHPMHLRHAPTIARLFPESRFILALRHPCDVVLSCWLTNFRLNNAMASFLDLEDAAALYEAAFGQWEKARALLSLPVGEVVYERLVEDKDRELRPLFDWLGLNWPEGGVDHREAARARGTVITASYAQVTEPIYTRASGRWRRYEAHLAPVAARLAGWIERFGYGEGPQA
ncbi:tetratricopeptide (TPR) repeat protein [Novosphingobium sp. SG751A]|uniref:tetratricopeptide repeat-containing sulfotransferase family protein n=1 Tax=Novosphingobium sp. SG751A TaxID=2587000 RepID=UPI003530103A|nr:tetratricopeptide (TPR) repeat protein [Novosphingobium sp. SG751A]